VLETVSVMLQVASFRLTGKRIFAWRRFITILNSKVGGTKVIVRFWIISFRAGVGGSCNLEDPLMHSVVVGLGKTALVPALLAKRGIP